VKSLSPVALVQTGKMTASFETTHDRRNGVIVNHEPVSQKMVYHGGQREHGRALGDVTYNLRAIPQVCCGGPVNRGVAVGYGKVYVVTLDDPCWHSMPRRPHPLETSRHRQMRGTATRRRSRRRSRTGMIIVAAPERVGIRGFVAA